ncbi:S-layer homology domain-containing protein [Paenibacillus planticolens]|nr:S-layer homology domain-containing protein [Paenibacillus planticolens]
MRQKLFKISLSTMLCVGYLVPSSALASTASVGDAKMTMTKQTNDALLSALSGPASVNPSQHFKVVFGLANVKSPAYAQDLTFQYHADLYTFVQAKSLIDGVAIIASENVAPGQVRLLVASQGADHPVSGSANVVELEFASKPLSQNASGTITAKLVSLGDGEGKEFQADGSKVDVQVVVPSSGGDSDNNNNNNNNNGANTDKETGKDKDKDKDKSKDKEKIIVQLDKGQTKADVSLSQVSGTTLQIKNGQVAITIGKSIIDSILGQAGSVDGASIQVQMVPVTDSNAATTPAIDHSAKVKIAGQVYELSITLKKADSSEVKLTKFAEGLELSLPVESDVKNKNLLGIYYLNETTNQWEYIGGKFDKETNTINVKLSHLSKYAVLQYNKEYTDVPADHWAYDVLQTLSAKHLVSGVTDSEFNPNGLTTRAEFTSLLVRALGLQSQGKNSSFTDVTANDWYAGDVAAANAAGLITGVTDSTFAPNIHLTREQMAILLVRAYEYKNGKSTNASNAQNNYVDAANVSVWAREAVNKASAIKLLQGRSGGQFDPQSETLRVEAAQVIMNLLETDN